MIDKSCITITLAEYEELKSDSYFLQCLRNNGVDNWEWYGEACDEFNQGCENESS